MTKAIARVHPVHLMNVDWAPGGRQPSDQASRLRLWVRRKLTAISNIHHRHCYYYSARLTKGGRLSRPKHCSKDAQPVLKTVYRSSCRDKHNCQRRDSNLDPLTPQSDALTTRLLRPACYGPTMRKQGSCLERAIMQGTTPGARRPGRPRTAWMDNIKTWTGVSVEESIRMTEDRDKYGESTTMVWPTLGGRLKNRTVFFFASVRLFCFEWLTRRQHQRRTRPAYVSVLLSEGGWTVCGRVALRDRYPSLAGEWMFYLYFKLCFSCVIVYRVLDADRWIK